MDASIVIAAHQWIAARPALAAPTVLLAEDGLFMLPLALLAFWFWPGRGRPARREVVLASVLAGGGALLLVLVLGSLIDRPRPFVALVLCPLMPHGTDSSFPSDHTLLGVSLALPFFWRRPGWGIWLTIWALLVGTARVATAVHYPTDVLGSALLAILPAGAGLLLGAYLRARLPVLWRRLQASRI